jgi:1,4-alpha-glucan branching enzyme
VSHACQQIVWEKVLISRASPLRRQGSFASLSRHLLKTAFQQVSLNQMQTLQTTRSTQPHRSLNRYSARNMSKPVNFFCVAPEAATVSVVGDFNDWRASLNPMARQPDGSWQLRVPLNHGHHHYHFLVDGKPVLDPRAMGIARNEKNERVSLIAVS